MKNYNKSEKIGFVLLVIGVLFFISEKILDIESLTSIRTYGQIILMAGAAIWVIGYRQRTKASKDKDEK